MRSNNNACNNIKLIRSNTIIHNIKNSSYSSYIKLAYIRKLFNKMLRLKLKNVEI